MIKVIILRFLVFTLLFQTFVASASSAQDRYRLVLAVKPDHSRIVNGHILNNKHNAIGIARAVDVNLLDNEYVGLINFNNSYHNTTTALTYEAGVGSNGFILGVRALLMKGYVRGDDQIGGYFLSNDVSLALMPFLRIEHASVFVELLAFDPKVPGLAVGVTF